MLDALVQRRARIYLILNSIKPCHQHCREREIRVARRIGRTELEPLRFGALREHGYSHRGRSIAARVREIDGSLEPRQKPFVTIGRWRCKCSDRAGALQKTADIVQGQM